LKKSLLISLLVVATITLAAGGWIVSGVRTIVRPSPAFRPRPA
jgi:hypothetical protein